MNKLIAIICFVLFTVLTNACNAPTNDGIPKEVKAAKLPPEDMVEVTLTQLGLNDEAEKYTISSEHAISIVTKGKIKLEIPANAFVDARGNPVTGEVVLKVKDMTTPAEMFSEPMSTVTADGLLATRGMVKIEALSKGREVRLADGKTIDLTFPGPVKSYAGAELYYGVENEQGILEWEKGGGQTEQSPADWERDYVLQAMLSTERKADSDAPDFTRSQRDSILQWLTLNALEKEQLAENPIVVYWTLFSDGDFEIYHVRSNAPTALRDKVVKQLNEMPYVPAFLRSGEAADISGVLDIYALKVENPVDAFVLKSYQLGWINCDVFYRIDDPMIDMKIPMPSEGAVMKLVFNDYETIVSGTLDTEGYMHFTNVPEGSAVWIVTLYPQLDNVMYSVTETKVQAERVSLNAFERMHKEDIAKRLNTLF